MNDDPSEQPADKRETQRAFNEAKERLMRLQVWLNGLLAGGPSLAEAVKPWREGLSIGNSAAETFADDQNDLPVDVKFVLEPLMAACHRIRERCEQSGDPPIDISGEESGRRLTEVLEKVQAGRRAGEEFTPMHVVMAARYIEGVIDSERYHSQATTS